MSPQDKDKHEHDDNLSQLYHQGAQEKAPVHLSRKIRQASKQAIEEKTRSTSIVQAFIQHLLSSRGLAFSAVMIIGISIILQIQFEQPEEILPEALTDFIQTDPVTTSSPELSEQADEQISRLEQEAAKPAAPVQQKAASKLEVEKHREQKLAKHKRELQAARKKQQAQSTQQKLLRQAPSSSAFSADSLITPLQLNTEKACTELTQSACLASADCMLVKSADRLICKDSAHRCEKGFIQAAQLEQLCSKKQGCEYIAGKCHCDENENCHCDSMQPPGCQPVVNNSDGEP